MVVVHVDGSADLVSGKKKFLLLFTFHRRIPDFPGRHESNAHDGDENEQRDVGEAMLISLALSSTLNFVIPSTLFSFQNRFYQSL